MHNLLKSTGSKWRLDCMNAYMGWILRCLQMSEHISLWRSTIINHFFCQHEGWGLSCRQRQCLHKFLCFQCKSWLPNSCNLICVLWKLVNVIEVVIHHSSFCWELFASRCTFWTVDETVMKYKKGQKNQICNKKSYAFIVKRRVFYVRFLDNINVCFFYSLKNLFFLLPQSLHEILFGHLGPLSLFKLVITIAIIQFLYWGLFIQINK